MATQVIAIQPTWHPFTIPADTAPWSSDPQTVQWPVYIEMQGDDPFQVTTEHRWDHGDKQGTSQTHFDIDYCKTYQEYICMAVGYGPADEPIHVYAPTSCPGWAWWTAPGRAVELSNPDAGQFRLTEIPPALAEKIRAIMIDNAYSGNTVECITCDDRFPDDAVCEHLWLCDEHGVWNDVADPDSSDGCQCKQTETGD